jgi:hypothetical protein
MAYLNYLAQIKTFLTNWSSCMAGNGSTNTFDYKISTAKELNNLKNAVTVNDMVQMGNAYYDQVGIGRAMTELYKKPKDYFADFVAFNTTQLADLTNLGNEVTNSYTNISDTSLSNKSIKSISAKLQLKLSLISSPYDNN